MPYKALSNTVSVHMGKAGKYRIGGEQKFAVHCFDIDKREQHNRNVDRKLTPYNVNIIFNGNGEIDTRDIPKIIKFRQAFSRRISQRKRRDTLGRKISIKNKTVSRETLWYPPAMLFSDAKSIDECQNILKKYINDMLPFWKEQLGASNIIAVSGHLDERKLQSGRPHIHLLTVSMVDSQHEWEEVKSVKRKNGYIKKLVKHSEFDIYDNTFWGGAPKMRALKDAFRKHNIASGYDDVKLEDMSEDERLRTGAVFSAEGLEAFQQMMDEREDLENTGLAITLKKSIIKKQSIELEKRKQIIKQKEAEIEKQKIEYENKLKVINNHISSLKSTIELLKKETPEKRYLRMTKQENEFLKWQKNGEPDLSKRTADANKLLQSVINTYFSDEISL